MTDDKLNPKNLILALEGWTALDTSERQLLIRNVMTFLVETGLTVLQIEEQLDGRVTERTLYRWLSGDTAPQNERVLETLLGLVRAREQTFS